MIRVFIADDEYMIIEGLKRMVDWSKNGYSVIGDSDNGIKAYDKIKQLKPDIVFTDIKMPGMSGLDIISAAKKDNLKCKFIIISGYSEFKFCQEALRLEVCDYILKPIDFSTIIPLVNNIQKCFIKSDQYKSAALKQYFISIISGSEDSSGHNSKDIEKDIDTNLFYNICVFSTNNTSNKLESYFDFSLCCHFIYKNRLIFVVGENCKQCLNEKISKVNGYLSAEPKNSSAINFSFGKSGRLNDIYQSYMTAVNVLENKIFYKGNYRIKDNEGKYESDKYLRNRVKLIVAGLKEFDGETVQKELENFFNYTLHNSVKRNLVVELVKELYIMIENLYEGNYIELKCESDKLDNVVDIFELKASVVETLNNLITSLKSFAKNDPIENIKSYIDKNYMNNISLNSISNSFFFNPSYLSRLFKEKTNTTFTDYVNNIRINKAKTLLLSSELSIDKISVMLGYSSYRYFIKVFRRYTGNSPQEYRKNSEYIKIKCT